MESVLLRARGVSDSRSIATYLAAALRRLEEALGSDPTPWSRRSSIPSCAAGAARGSPGRKWSFVPKDHPGRAT